MFHSPFWKGRLGKTCLSKMHSNQMETLSLNSTKVSCQIERSWIALQVTFLRGVGEVGGAVGFFKQKGNKMQPETLQQVLAWTWHLIYAVMQSRHWSCQFHIINMKGGEIKTVWDFILTYYPRLFFVICNFTLSFTVHDYWNIYFYI